MGGTTKRTLDEMKRLRTENEQLRAVLKPFVEADWYAVGWGKFDARVSGEAISNAKTMFDHEQ